MDRGSLAAPRLRRVGAALSTGLFSSPWALSTIKSPRSRPCMPRWSSCWSHCTCSFKKTGLLRSIGRPRYSLSRCSVAVSTLFTRSLPVTKIALPRDSPWFCRHPLPALSLIRGPGFRVGLQLQPEYDDNIRAVCGQNGSSRRQVCSNRPTPDGQPLVATIRCRCSLPCHVVL